MPLIVNPAFHRAGIAGRTEILGQEHVRLALEGEHDLIEYHHVLGHECSYAQIWTRPALARGVRSLVVVAMTAVLTPAGASLRAHLRGAVINGVARAELRQLMATVSFYLGAGIGTEVIATAAAELGALRPGDPGYGHRDAEVLTDAEGLRRRGRALREQMFGTSVHAAADDAAAETLADAEAVYQRMRDEYVFGVLWAHPDMPVRTRVLIVLGMLCASGRTGPLESYLRAARRLGCSWTEVKEVFLTAFVYCGDSAAEVGFRLARKVFADAPAADHPLNQGENA